MVDIVRQKTLKVYATEDGKDSQDRDIEKAKGYWQAYQEEQDEQETEKP